MFFFRYEINLIFHTFLAVLMSRKETNFVRLLHGKTKNLKLTGKELNAIPDSIGVLQSLSSLDARNNKLSSLPTTIQLLNNLRCLNLGNNKFENVPNVISKISTLQTIFLYSNPLADISGLCSNSLRELTTLNLRNCFLNIIPKQIKLLQSLEVLVLSFNKLEVLPEELFELKTLKELLLDNNSLEVLPNNIGNLILLRKLLLPHNNIVALPESIANLEYLEVLDIGCNCVQMLPSGITSMFLNELYCEHNPLLEEQPVRSSVEHEVFSLREISARFIMKELKKINSEVRLKIKNYPDIIEQLSSSIKCEVCQHPFIYVWLECVRFVKVSELKINICSVQVIPQKVFLCSYNCFNSPGHNLYGIAFKT